MMKILDTTAVLMFSKVQSGSKQTDIWYLNYIILICNIEREKKKRNPKS